VGRRVVASILLLAFLFEIIDFPQFIWMFCLMFPLQFVAILLVLARKKQLKLTWGFGKLPLKALLDFGFFSFLAFGGDLLVNRIDQLMIAKYVNLESVAYYTIAFFIGNVINIPNRASGGIAKPIVVSSLENGKMDELNELYKKSSVGLTLAAGLLFVFIVPNLPQIFTLLPLTFEGGILVTFLIALSKLISTSIGLNGLILSMSPYYRVTLWINIGLLVTTVLTNLWLIPLYGIAGAAIATMIVIVFNNMWKTIFLWSKYKLLPFSRSYLSVLVWIFMVSGLFFYFTQTEVSPWLGIPVRAIVGGLTFLAPIYYFKLFPDLNTFLSNITNRLKKLGRS
jgi:O-antigen/teichoic acid export membrane protein